MTSGEWKTLRARAERVAPRLGAAAEDLLLALKSVQADPKNSLVKATLVIEHILFERLGRPEGKRRSARAMADDLGRSLPEVIRTHMSVVTLYRNRFGAHMSQTRLEAESIFPAMEALVQVAEWHADERPAPPGDLEEAGGGGTPLFGGLVQPLTIQATLPDLGFAYLTHLVGFLVTATLAMYAVSNPYQTIEVLTGLVCLAYLNLGATNDLLSRKDRRLRLWTLAKPPVSRWQVLAVFLVVAAALVLLPELPLLGPDQPVEGGLARRAPLALYAGAFGALSARGGANPYVRVGSFFVALSTLLSLGFVTAYPIIRQRDGVLSFEDAAIIATALMTLGLSVQTFQLVRSGPPGDGATSEPGGDTLVLPAERDPPHLALASCFATFMCLTMAQVWFAQGALRFGLVRYAVLYTASLLAAFGVLYWLRTRWADDLQRYRTPFSALVDGPSRGLAVFCGVSLMYGALAVCELRVLRFTVEAALDLGTQVGYLAAAGTGVFALYCVHRGQVWGSIRTDVLQLVHILALMGLMAGLGWFLVEPAVWWPAVRDAAARPPHSVDAAWWESWGMAAGMFLSNMLGVLCFPDLWSRFALVVPRKDLRWLLPVAFVGVASVALIIGLIAVAVFPELTAWRQHVGSEFAVATIEHLRPRFVGGASWETMAWRSWALALFSVLFFSALTTLDTCAASLSQYLHLRAGSGDRTLWPLTLGVAAVAVGVSAVSYDLSLNVLAAYTPYLAISLSPVLVGGMLGAHALSPWMVASRRASAVVTGLVVLAWLAMCLAPAVRAQGHPFIAVGAVLLVAALAGLTCLFRLTVPGPSGVARLDLLAACDAALTLACLGMGLVGLLLATDLLPGAFDPWTRAIERAFRDEGPLLAGHHRWMSVVLGTTMLGWGVLLAAVARGPYRRRERWARWALLASVFAWYIGDTAFSLMAGVTLNALVNSLGAICIAGPVVISWRAFDRAGAAPQGGSAGAAGASTHRHFTQT